MSRLAAATLVCAGCFSKPPFDVQPPDASSDAAPSDVQPDGAIVANIAFVTAATHSVDELLSVAAADNVCREAAITAGLPANTYVAWLSTPGAPASSRLAGARGWVRTDGRPFADTVNQIVTGQIYYPLRLDEAGNDFNVAVVMTATTPLGQLAINDCNGLMGGTSEQMQVGAADSTRNRWTDNGSATCATQVHVYCFGTDHNTAVLLPAPAAGRKAFVSTTLFALSSVRSSSIGSADAICGDEASAKGLSGTFLALLATISNGATTRFNQMGPTWVRMDGIPLAATADAVMNGDLETPLNVTIDSAYIADENVWTGIDNTGTLDIKGSATCDDWTVDTGLGNTGNAVRTNNLWFRSNTAVSCGAAKRVYCFEQ